MTQPGNKRLTDLGDATARQPLLAPPERIIWQGRPARRIVWRPEAKGSIVSIGFILALFLFQDQMGIEPEILFGPGNIWKTTPETALHMDRNSILFGQRVTQDGEEERVVPTGFEHLDDPATVMATFRKVQTLDRAQDTRDQ